MAITTSKIRKMKKNEKISMVTCYDFPSAQILDEAGIDMLLVGDSLSSVVLGYDSTIMVTIEDMAYHTRAVARGCKNAMIVTDMPFLSTNISIGETLENAGKLLRAGATAVKIEGCDFYVISALTGAGIPVVGHVGLLPQSINQLGGHFIQGKTVSGAQKIIDEALKFQEAGAFCVLMECVPSEVAKAVTERLQIPTIGIGAGSDCDGQVLVLHDLIGFNNRKVPSFVKQYANVSEVIKNAVCSYNEDVKNGSFPDKDHSFYSEKLEGLY